MYNLLLTIDISQVDSLAKMVNPDAEISSPSWWIYILGTCVFAIIGFLIKHYFKGLVLDGRPRPEIRISEGSAKKDIIYLPKSNLIDIDNAVAQKLQEQMAILKRNYSSRSLDVYQDMNLVFQSNFNNVKNYNDDVESYIEGMHLYYNRTLKDQLMSECYKKVSFVLYAKGKKVCNNLNVEISIGGENLHVFALNSRVEKRDKHDVAPDVNKDRSSDLYGMFTNEMEEYVYGEWQIQPQFATCHYICQNLVSGCPNKEIIPAIYVDTRYEQRVLIHWKINGADIPEEGRNGELIINVG